MILFIGGLYCYKNFEKYITEVFKKKNKEIFFRTCREVSQEDIDKSDIIIAYSYAIQYIYDYNLGDKKIILLCPLLNGAKYKTFVIDFASFMSRFKTKPVDYVMEKYLKFIGADPETLEPWKEDIMGYIEKYGYQEKPIRDLIPLDRWIILDGEAPVAYLPWVNDFAVDNNGKKIKHILNYDNNLNFLDKYL